MDDTIVIWPHREPKPQDFLQHLNILLKSIMKLEKDGTPPFLDVLIKRLHNSQLRHSVYYKPTHTDRYLHANSNHPAQRTSVIKKRLHRAESISTPDSLQSEINRLDEAF